MDISRTQHSGVVFYRCADFPDDVPHGFSTKIGGVSVGDKEGLNLARSLGDSPENVRENFQRFCAATGTDCNQIVKNKQVHGDVVRTVTREDVMPSPEAIGFVEADGLVTDVPGLCLTIFSGDCLPILLCDPVKRVVAAAHAGWRGTVKGIAERAVEAMVDRFACQVSDIRAAIGPGLSSCCFETHCDVPEALRTGLGDASQPLIAPLQDEGKFSVDLKGANVCFLERAGLLTEHIAVSDACTGCAPELFWSHRMQGLHRGSMAAVIAIAER